MSKRLSSLLKKFGVVRSIGIAISILGIVSLIFFMVFGDKIVGSVDHVVFQYGFGTTLRNEIGRAFGFGSSGGFDLLPVLIIGFIALIVSASAKNTVKRVFLNVLGAVSVLIIVALGSNVLKAYKNYQEVAQRRENTHPVILAQAEQGNANAQIEIGMDDYRKCQYADDPTVPCSCPEALHWYHKAAFQGVGRGMENVSAAYALCPPGGYQRGRILALVWHALAVEDSSADSLLRLHRESTVESLTGYLEPDARADTLATAEALTIRAREIFSMPDMSAADRELAMESAIQEMMPSFSGDNGT